MPAQQALALHCLGLNGFEVYCPRLREQRLSRGRKIVRTPPLFPGYAFMLVVSGLVERAVVRGGASPGDGCSAAKFEASRARDVGR
jgi:hypothetical protein